MAIINRKEILFSPVINISGAPIEIDNESEMTSMLEVAKVGTIYKYTGTTGLYENGAIYVITEV